jgi:hypothetical protein
MENSVSENSIINLSSTTPATPPGAATVYPQGDDNANPRNVSFYVDQATATKLGSIATTLDLSGSGVAPMVSGIMGNPISLDPPNQGDVLVFDDGGGDRGSETSLQWKPLPTSVAAGGVGIVIDGAGSVPTTGSKGFCQMPYAGTITGWTILADVSGSCVVTVKKSDYSTFPTTSSIVASAKPTLSSAQKAANTTLTGWTTGLASGDILEFNLDSVTTCKRIMLKIQITKS